MINLKSAPFNLTDPDICWVKTTLDNMTLEQKIGQLFMPVGLSSDRAELSHIIKDYQPAGMMFRPGKSSEIQEIHRFLQNCSNIPLLIASNLESGGNGSATDGTEFACQMQVAATGDSQYAKHLAMISAQEGKALGVNWTFAPVVDIDINPHNPITNVRTFGSNSDTVTLFAKQYVQEMVEQNMATSPKHFPGDGLDSRDQHIATTYNTLSVEQWNDSYGKIYQAVINAGTLSIMAGHIGLPSYVKQLDSDSDPTLPASLSKPLLQDLLRERLGFNGVIVTDATAMVGFTAAMPRAQAVPTAIASGCDLFLFNKDLGEDIEFMRQGIETGLLTIERVDEAITRTLAMKAALKLHLLNKDQLVPDPTQLEIIGAQNHKQLALACANSSITLVKDNNHFLPINPKSHPRVLLFTLTDDGDFFGQQSDVFKGAIDLLQQKGFNIDRFDPSKFMTRDTKLSVNKLIEQYDFALYLSNIKPASNKTSLRLSWTRPMGIDAPWFSAELPTVFISFGNPYHLFDVPKVQTYINAYTATPHSIRAAIEKLLGESDFVGVSPVDAFLGCWDTRL